MNMERIHLILFMGQSNMAGRGTAEEAPAVLPGTGYEFRAVSDPNRLYPLTEPFGRDENDNAGVYEPGMKTGSLVSAFVNAYAAETKATVVGVSCSKGGSTIAEWQPEMPYYQDAVRRTKRCQAWLQSQNIRIEHCFMVWCQGCSDADRQTEPEVYRQQTVRMLHAFRSECCIETCFLIQIGNHRDNPQLYVPIQNAQLQLARQEKDVVLVSRQFASFAGCGLMKDKFHYYQEGYNRVGAEAGQNAGSYVMGLNPAGRPTSAQITP